MLRNIVKLAGGLVISLLIPGIALAAMNAAGPQSDQEAPGFAQPVNVVGVPATGGALPITLAHGWTTVYIANSALTVTTLLDAGSPNGVTVKNGWTTTYIANAAFTATVLLDSGSPNGVTIRNGWTTTYIASSINLPVTVSNGWTTVYISNMAFTSTVLLDADSPNGVTIKNGWTTTYIASSANLPVTLSHGWTTVYVASTENNLPTTTVFQAGIWSVGSTPTGWTTVYVASTENNLPSSTVFQGGTWTVGLSSSIYTIRGREFGSDENLRITVTGTGGYPAALVVAGTAASGLTGHSTGPFLAVGTLATNAQMQMMRSVQSTALTTNNFYSLATSSIGLVPINSSAGGANTLVAPASGTLIVGSVTGAAPFGIPLSLANGVNAYEPTSSTVITDSSGNKKAGAQIVIGHGFATSVTMYSLTSYSTTLTISSGVEDAAIHVINKSTTSTEMVCASLISMADALAGNGFKITRTTPLLLPKMNGAAITVYLQAISDGEETVTYRGLRGP